MKRMTLLLLASLLACPAVYPQARRPGGARARDEVTGRYVLRHSNVRGRLDARLLPGNQVRFSLTVPSATYRDGECRISMKFLGARVVVEESNAEDCGFGAFVTAQGMYVRKSRSPRFDR